MILIVSLHPWTSTPHSKYPSMAMLTQSAMLIQSAMLMKIHTTGHKHGPLCAVSYCVRWEEAGLKEESETRDRWHLGHPGVSHPRTPVPCFPNSLIFPKIPQDWASFVKNGHGSSISCLILPFSGLMLGASQPIFSLCLHWTHTYSPTYPKP